MDVVSFTIKLDKTLHAQFKSICSLKHIAMQEKVIELIKENVKLNSDWLPSTKEKENVLGT